MSLREDLYLPPNMILDERYKGEKMSTKQLCENSKTGAGPLSPAPVLKRRIWKYWEVRPLKKMSYVDEKTGEICEGWPPDKVDRENYEPIERLVARFVGTGILPPQGGMYEVPPDMSPEEAIAQSFINQRGIDRVDRANLLSTAAGLFAELADKQKKEREAKKDEKNKKLETEKVIEKLPPKEETGK